MAEQDFNLDDGRPVTVEYTYRPGSETTYSPMYGATGGDGCEVEITHCWPNAPEFERLCENQRHLKNYDWPLIVRPFAWLGLQIVKLEIALSIRDVRPTDKEYERFEAWIAENHVYEPYDPEDF